MKHSNKPNSWITELTGGTPQLTYALQVNPAPLIVSVPGAAPILASLEFIVTNPTGNTLEVDSVTFTLQVGTASDCITTTTSGINTAVSDTTDWTVTGPSSIITSGSATYTLAPTTGSSVSLAPGASVVVLLFQVQTNTVAGNSTVTIKEIVGSTPGFTNFLIPTFPDSFFFNGLVASVQSGATLTPVAQIATGDTITLTWNSSVIDVSAFYILYSSAGQGQQKANPSDIGEWTSPALTDDTVFTVVVTTSVAGGQPLTASMSIGVSIQNPSIVAASLTSNTAAITGSATIGSDLSVAGLISTNSTHILYNSQEAVIDWGTNNTGSLHFRTLAQQGNIGSFAEVVTISSSGDISNTGNINCSKGISANSISANNFGYISSSSGAMINGNFWLANAPDYSAGTVAIGGTLYSNYMLTVSNTQTTGVCVGIFGQNLDSGLGAWALAVWGQCINTTGSWVQMSDINLKENVTAYGDGLKQLLQINPLTFTYKEESGLGSKKEHVGVSAQDIQKIAPYMVSKVRLDPDSDAEYLSIDPGPLQYMLINAVKELSSKLDALQKEIDTLKKK